MKIKIENGNFNYERAAELHPPIATKYSINFLSFLLSHYTLAVGG
ncbi:MAG: hypothetical protein ACXVBZ_01465 [Flavisolibacter sp.]